MHTSIVNYNVNNIIGTDAPGQQSPTARNNGSRIASEMTCETVSFDCTNPQKLVQTCPRFSI